jgi:hypothetical protein
MIATCLSLPEAPRTARLMDFVKQVAFATTTTKRVDLAPHYSLEE